MADPTNENDSEVADEHNPADHQQQLRDEEFSSVFGTEDTEDPQEDNRAEDRAEQPIEADATSATGETLDPSDAVDDSTGQDEDPFRAQHTSLQCLALIARHHGLDVSADRLIHDYGLEEEEPSLRRVLRIAKDAGFKAKHTRLTWKHLQRMEQAFPAIARLENGNYVIMIGLRKSETEDGKILEEIALFDPLADRTDFIFLDQATFEKSWKGETLLTKRNYSMLDSNQPFSLRWFLPEVFRQRTAFDETHLLEKNVDPHA